MMRAISVFAAVAVAAVLATAAAAQVRGPMAPPPGRSGVQAPRLPAPAAPRISIDQALARARQYLATYQNADLVTLEILEFSAAYYVVVGDRRSGKGAFPLVVDPVTGNVRPEMGPTMMWNTAYGIYPPATLQGRTPGPGAGYGGRWHGGMMGWGMMGSMMGPGAIVPGQGPGWGPGAGVAPQGQAPAAALDEARARAVLQAWVAQAFPGAGIGKVVEFPGFFTYRLTRDGKTFALASVHAYSGRVWYAWRYGTFVREQAAQ